jgi:DNA-binding XRE family transcriptional regulator
VAGPSGERPVNLSAQERLFAAEVSRARAAAGVSQEWVGRQIGLSRSKVSEVCSGRYLPARETAVLLVEALGMDRHRTLRLWQDARAARDLRRRQIRQPSPPVVEWDRLPVLPGEAMSLLRAHVDAAEELPYLLPGARRPSLSTVYVRQELGGGLDDPTVDRRIPRTRALDGAAGSDLVVQRDLGRSEAFVRSAPPRVAMRPPGRPVREALDGHEHVLITGGPGQGKSTLTLRLAADIATAWVGRGEDAETVTAGDPPLAEPVVPVRLPARVLAARMDLPLPEALAGAVSAEYGLMLDAPVAAALFGGRVGGCRWLLLVDAVDEIADPQLRARFVRILAGWISKSSDRPYRLLVTSRPVESGGLGPLHHGAARFELQPFDTDALRRFADHWFGTRSDAGQRFLRQIRQARLDELVRVPLLATIAAIICDQHRDRPLPDNQYDLYEEYLTYLASAHRWPDESGPFGELIRQLRPSLLEHLGATRYHADVSLAAAARDWMLERTTALQRPAGWQATMVAILRAVGPFVVRGDDLQFLHHSFAEHLAATERARRLPVPFEAEHPTWAHTIHAAQYGLATKFARAILLHYTHIHPDQADHLITWLHDNSSAYQRIAAELLAQHAPASPAVMDTFLATARAWAKTATGIDILRQATGATHHPRLASWLRDLMHESKATWSARIDAAVVLCTRLEAESSDAVHLLQTAMDDPALDIADRVTAAQGLAKIGPAHRAVAIRGLRQALRDSSATGYTRRAAAVALADLGSDCRTEAIEALRAALGDSTTPPQDEVQTAIGLAEIGFEFHHEAIARLRTVARDTGIWLYSRTHAALALGDLGSIYLDQAADLLDEMVTDRSQTTWNRCRFAGALAELGPEYTPRAVDHLLAILAEPFITSQERYNAAGELAKAHPSYHTAAADHLRQVLADPGLHTNSRLWTARALAELGPAYHEEAAHQFRQVATDPSAADWEECDAAVKLASLGPHHRDEAVVLLRRKLTDPAVDAGIRIAAAGELAELGTEFHDEAATTLGLIMIDPSHTDRDRADAAGKLAGLSTAAHSQAAEILRTILRNPTASGAARRYAAHELATLGPIHRTEAAAGLRAALWDDSCESIDRVNAARYLTELGQEYRADAATGLRAMLNRSDASISYSMVASVLSELGAEFRAEAADTLRAFITNPTEEPDRRLAAADALADLGQDHRDEITNMLHAILSDPAADAHCRQQAAASILRYGPEHDTAAATSALLSVLRNPMCPHWTRRQAAEALAQLGGQYLDDTINSLQSILADPATSARDRPQLAEVLAALGDEPRSCAASHLRAMIADPGTRVPDRVEAFWQLSRIDLACRDEAVAYLTGVLSDDAVSATDRCAAADHLVRLDRGALAQATRVLRLMMASPLANQRTG